MLFHGVDTRFKKESDSRSTAFRCTSCNGPLLTDEQAYGGYCLCDKTIHKKCMIHFLNEMDGGWMASDQDEMSCPTCGHIFNVTRFSSLTFLIVDTFLSVFIVFAVMLFSIAMVEAFRDYFWPDAQTEISTIEFIRVMVSYLLTLVFMLKDQFSVWLKIDIPWTGDLKTQFWATICEMYKKRLYFRSAFSFVIDVRPVKTVGDGVI